jgi:hypothetical protein
MKSLLLSLCVMGCFPLVGNAQHINLSPHIGVEQVPIGDEVYPFLRHLSVRGAIEKYSEAQLPLSEFEVVEFLRTVDPVKLSSAEQDLLRKFLQTYAHEPREAVTWFEARDSKSFFFEGLFTDEDKYLYRWFDDSTKSDLFVHAIGSLEVRHQSNPRSATVGLLNYGGRFSGTLSGHVGYYLQTTNGQEFGDSLLALDDPLLSKNRNLAFYSHTFFDFTSAEFTYSYDWFTGKLAREAVSIGGGYQNDNILLSPNVPYFDFLSLGAHVGQVHYQALVGSLLDDTLTGGAEAQIPPKFLVLHDLTVGVGSTADFGISDILIFSKRYELAYLNPFSFLKSVEHSLNDRDNGLLGAHARWRITPGVEARGQMLLDDIVMGQIGKGYWGNKFAWQLGAMWAGAFGASDLDLMAEWIRVEPYTYSHFSPNNRYSTSQTVLGAQIGPNAQSYWSALRWAPSAKWTVMLEGQYVQRGENVFDSSGHLIYNTGGDYTISLTDESSPNNTHFLYGRRVNIFTLTANIEFEPLRGLVVFARGTKRSVDYLEDIPQTPGINTSGIAISLAPKEFPETVIAIGARALF